MQANVGAQTTNQTATDDADDVAAGAKRKADSQLSHDDAKRK
jgi:hypothetical protein